MQPGAPFVQFTYAVVPPIPARCEAGSYTASGSNRVWLNLPRPASGFIAGPDSIIG